MKNRSSVFALAKAERGVPILGCLPGSPAERAGLRYGDILLYFNGQRTETIPDYLKARGSAGDTSEAVVRRDGEILTFTFVMRDASGVTPFALAQQLVAGKFLAPVEEVDERPN